MLYQLGWLSHCNSAIAIHGGNLSHISHMTLSIVWTNWPFFAIWFVSAKNGVWGKYDGCLKIRGPVSGCVTPDKSWDKPNISLNARQDLNLGSSKDQQFRPVYPSTYTKSHAWLKCVGVSPNQSCCLGWLCDHQNLEKNIIIQFCFVLVWRFLWYPKNHWASYLPLPVEKLFP